MRILTKPPQERENLEEFVNRVFPRFTDAESNILSEEAIVDVLTNGEFPQAEFPQVTDEEAIMRNVTKAPEKREDIEEFMNRVFPQITGEETNILSEEEMIDVLPDDEFPQVTDEESNFFFEEAIVDLLPDVEFPQVTDEFEEAIVDVLPDDEFSQVTDEESKILSEEEIVDGLPDVEFPQVTDEESNFFFEEAIVDLLPDVEFPQVTDEESKIPSEEAIVDVLPDDEFPQVTDEESKILSEEEIVDGLPDVEFPQVTDKESKIPSQEAIVDVLPDVEFPQVTDEESKILSEEEIVDVLPDVEFPQVTDEESKILSEEEIVDVLPDVEFPQVTDEEKALIDVLPDGKFPQVTDDEQNNILSEKAIIDVSPDGQFPQEEEPMEEEVRKQESLDLSDCVITLSPQYHPNLVHINLANAYGVGDEEEILNLLKMDMVSLEYFNISFIRFRNPRYPLKRGFARAFWQHVADYAINQWPKLQTVTAYGYPLKNIANTLKIAQKVRSLNATVTSAKRARIMLNQMPEETAKCSNLCDKWSGLISAEKTQYTNTGASAHIPVDDEFVSVLVPSYIDVDVERIEGEVEAAIKTILTNTPLDVSILIAFPFFVAKSREKSPQYTPEEIELLRHLCCKAIDLGLEKKYAIQIKFFSTILGNHSRRFSDRSCSIAQLFAW